MFRIGTVRRPSSLWRVRATRLLRTCLLTAATPAKSLKTRSGKSTGPRLKLSNARMTQKASLLLPDAGSSNARWHGLTAADVSPKIGRPPSPRLKHGSLLRQPDNWCAASPDWQTSSHNFESDSQTYHQFADQRELFGIPNFWNVISNLPFVAVGAVGLWKFHRDATTT